MGAEAKSGWMR
jgi:hypothetical protein